MHSLCRASKLVLGSQTAAVYDRFVIRQSFGAARGSGQLSLVPRPSTCRHSGDRTRHSGSVISAAMQDATAAAAAQGPLPKAAVGQMTSVGDQEANFNTCARLAQDAAAAGCSMLFLPECFSFIGSNQQESIAAAQPLSGALVARYCELARSHKLWLSLGGFQETGPDPEHIFNTHLVIDQGGEVRAAYRKIHLFDVDVPSGPVLMESRSTAPGTQALVCDSPVGRLGLSTCYDLRFPELYQKLTWSMGAQVLLVPAAFTRPTGEAHWEVLLRARAIECQTYVIAAAQAGRHNEKRESYGHALIIDPWGRVVARLADPSATGIAVAEIDLNQIAAIRTKMPIREHREKGHKAYLEGV